jgi:hypothetical protein
MTIRGARLRALAFFRSQVADHVHQSSQAASPDGRGHLAPVKRQFSPLWAVGQLEQDCRALQDGIDRAQEAIDRTFALISGTRDSGRLRDAEHVSIREDLKARTNSHLRDAA